MWTRQFVWVPVLALLGVPLMAGCAAEAPGPESETAANVVEEPAMPATIADLFPDGPGKALVLDNCSVCHAVACSAIGQRTNGRWDSLKEDHRDRASNLPEEDLETLFAYLKMHFSDSRPEPMVPAHFLEGGCTLF